MAQNGNDSIDAGKRELVARTQTQKSGFRYDVRRCSMVIVSIAAVSMRLSKLRLVGLHLPYGVCAASKRLINMGASQPRPHGRRRQSAVRTSILSWHRHVVVLQLKPDARFEPEHSRSMQGMRVSPSHFHAAVHMRIMTAQQRG